MSLLNTLVFRNFARNFAAACLKTDSQRLSRIVLPDGIEETEGFYRDDMTKEHSFFLHYPEGRDPKTLPLLIDIHGGGFVYGDKELNVPFNKTMAGLGFAVFSMTYTLAPKATVYTQTQEILDAILYAFSRQDRLGIRFDNVSLAGDSAGALLASIVYATANDTTLQSLLNRRLNIGFGTLVLNHPATDTADIGKQAGYHGLAGRIASSAFAQGIYGKGFCKNPFYQRVSSFDSLMEGIAIPKVCLITSTGDTLVRDEALHVKEVLEKKGSRMLFIDNSEGPNTHVYNVLEINAPTSIRTNRRIADFLKQN